jgi:hypothetical protein
MTGRDSLDTNVLVYAYDVSNPGTLQRARSTLLTDYRLLPLLQSLAP